MVANLETPGNFDLMPQIADLFKSVGWEAQSNNIKESEIFTYVFDYESMVAFGSAKPFFGRHCKLTNICVRPCYRNNGFGKFVVNDLISQAKDHGYDTVSLVLSSHPHALKLYNSLGFTQDAGCGYMMTRNI